ncbi:MAG TPA: DUF4328 domain-containing protein, partial [Pseudonocardiaceae bacterium]
GPAGPTGPAGLVPPKLPPYAGRNERLGRLAMLLWAPVQLLNLALLGLAAGRFLPDLTAYLDEVARAPAGELVPFPARSFLMVMLASLSGLLALIPLAMLIIWAHRCATTAAALRFPAQREPVWAVIGWIVPVVNFWFPYQSMRDCLPPDHPARPDVLRWWLCYLAIAVGGAVLIPLGALEPGLFAVALVALAAVAAVLVLLGFRVARAIDRAHRAAGRQL